MKQYVLVLLILVTISLAGCNSSEPVRKISLHSQPVIKEQGFQTDNKSIRFAISISLSPSKTQEVFTDIAIQMEKNTNIPVKIVTRKSITEITKLIIAQDVDIALVPVSTLIELQDKKVPITIAAIIKSQEGILHYPTILLNNPQIIMFEQLRSQRFALLDPASEAGAQNSHLAIQKLEATPDSFFRSYYYSYGYDLSLGALNEGIIDAMASDSWFLGMLDDNLTTKHVIKQNERIPNHVLIFTGRLDKTSHEKILTGLRAPETLRLLKKVNIEDFTPADEMILELITEYLNKRVL